MNRIFNLIWSKTKEKWIVVSEKVKGNGKVPTSPLFSIAVLTAFFSSGGVAYGIDSGTLPTGGSITSGTGSITSSGTQMTINQSTEKMIANWGAFNIGENAAVRFNQPGIAAVALNRIADRNPSQIMGSLTANGQVFLLNLSGIIFGKNATVNVGGLVASSLNLLDSDFLAGKYTFSNNGSAGTILNQGAIKALDGGVVALMAPAVTNEGSITTNSGSLLLAAGNQVTLDFTGDGLINYTVDQGAVDALVANKGLLKADGGVVVMTARAADALRIATATNSGVIEARTLQNKAGRILLLSDMENGQTLVSGTLDASAPDGGNGGFIETSSGRVNISDGTVVTTRATQGKSGTWLIDPDGFTLAATGGDMTGATLSLTLSGLTDVEIKSTVAGSGSDGNINVNDVVQWSKNKLTLTATNDINVNAVMTANDTASLDLEPGSGNVNMGFNTDGTFKGRVDFFYVNKVDPRSGNGFLTINKKDYTVITDFDGSPLQSISVGDEGQNDYVHYALGCSISSIGTFTPIGRFFGTFDGLGHTLSGLVIESDNNCGLFSDSCGKTVIRNIGLVNASVNGVNSRTGGLMGWNYGAISNASVSGSSVVSAGNYVGGLVGTNDDGGTITNSHVLTGSVEGSVFVGGLVGNNYGAITSSYATGNVTGTGDVGGLVGRNDGGKAIGTIISSFATGSVTGSEHVGGLVGRNFGTITTSFYDMRSSIKVGDGETGTLVAEVTPYGINGTLFDDWLSTADGKPARTLDVGKYFVLVDGYYQISSISKDFGVKGNIQNILGFVNDANTNKFRLMNDINLTGTEFWIPVFNAAELEGAGFKFTGLAINQPMNSQIGMIGNLGRVNPLSTIKNLGVIDVNVTGKSLVGGLVGYNYGTTTNCYATGSVVGKDNYAGGLVGDNYGTITSSYATGNVEGNDYVGGLTGRNTGTISNSYATGDVKGSMGDVNGSDGVGGLVGYNYNGSIDQSYATGKVTGNWYVGGLVGYNYNGSIDQSYATGNVTCVGNVIGGLVGSNYGVGNIMGSYATGTVEGVASVGGLVGNNYGAITDSYATGSVTGTQNKVGGLAGYNRSDISKSYATGSVISNEASEVGGLVGYNDGGSIDKSYATGIVTGSADVGGLVGYGAVGSISNSYATGNVTGTGIQIGGLVGYNSGTIANTCSMGIVTGSGEFIGALAGKNIGDISHSFYDSTVNSSLTGVGGGQSDAAGKVWGMSTANMKVLANFTTSTAANGNPDPAPEWDFTSAPVWKIDAGKNGGYPYLEWQKFSSSTTSVTYTLSDVTVTYKGAAYLLSDQWSATTLFGASYSDWAAGTDYSFSYDGSTVNGFTNTGSYSSLSINVLKSGFEVAEAGNITGFLTIGKAHLMVTADNQSRLYGASNPAFTETISGFVNGETNAVVSGTATGSSSATTATGVGTAVIIGSAAGLSASNYDFTAADGVLTIGKAHLTVTADNQSRLYGASNPAFTETISGFVNGETNAVVSGTATGSSSATTATGVGTAVIIGSAAGLSASNYDFTAADGVLTIGKAHLTVTADNQSRIYGTSNPTFTETITGFVNGETVKVLSGKATGSSAATATTDIGIVVITGSTAGLRASNYDFTAANGVLTITPDTRKQPVIPSVPKGGTLFYEASVTTPDPDIFGEE